MLPGIFRHSYSADRWMTRLSNKAPGNETPILPIEGAVTGGRSFWGWMRNGFLEFQERFLEEITVAAVWLYGVKSMDKIMDRVIERRQEAGKLRGIYTGSDWSKGFLGHFSSPGKKSLSILLSPLERFSMDYSALRKTLKVKGVKWAIAIAVPLLLCGYVIPRLNRIKTEWIIKRFYSKPSNSKTKESSSSKAHGAPLPQALPRFTAEQSGVRPVAIHQTSSSTAWNTPPSGEQRMPDWYAASSASYHPYAKPRFGSRTSLLPNEDPSFPIGSRGEKPGKSSPRFGFLSLSGLSLLSKAGHWVNNTPAGSVLVVDVGVTGGRMATAMKYSPFESLEYGARDAASLVFYLASVPWIMKGTSKFLESSWGRKITRKLLGQEMDCIIQLDAQVIRNLNEQIMKQIGKRPITKELFQSLLEGTGGESLQKARSVLGTRLRQASTAEFLELMKHELLAYGTSAEDTSRLRKLFEATEKHLQKTMKAGNLLSADQLESLLKKIMEKQGILGILTDADRFHLSTAAKMAFHQSAGLSEAGLTSTVLQSIPKELAAAEKTQLVGRLQQAARSGGDKVIASALRRSLLAANLTKALSHEAAKEAEILVRAVERSVIEGIPVNAFATRKLSHVVEEYRNFLKRFGGKAGENKTLLNTIERVSEALKSNGTLSRTTLEELAVLLEKNGRTLPRFLRWLQGPGLGHLAQDVRAVLPLVDQKIPLQELMNHHIRKTTTGFVKATASHPEQLQLISHYQKCVEVLLQGKGRASVLMTKTMPGFTEHLERQLSGILQGGLKNNDKLYDKALRILGRMPTQAESFFDPVERERIRKLIDPYLDRVTGRLHTYMEKHNLRAVNTVELRNNILKSFAKQNAKWRYGVWGTALLISMLGVGLLIPKLQYFMTRALTGKNSHPGLEAITNKLGGHSN